MDKLSTEFKRQSSPEIKDIVETCFEGQLAYVTQCTRCKWRSEREDKYSELSIPLKV